METSDINLSMNSRSYYQVIKMSVKNKITLKNEVRRLEELLEQKPRIVLPKLETRSRFLQLYVSDHPVFHCEEGISNEIAGSLVDRTLREFKIAPENKVQWRPGGAWYPEAKGVYYRVVGSGICLLRKTYRHEYEEDYELFLSVNQNGFQDYPPGVDKQHLNKLLKFSVKIGHYIFI